MDNKTDNALGNISQLGSY